MKQAKITCTFELIVDLDPDNYDPEINTVKEMLQTEKESFTYDPELILSFDWDNYTVTAEEIK